MDDLSNRDSASVESHRRRARLHDRAARATEEAANLHEYYASHCLYEDMAVDAHVHADRARLSAERSRVRGDQLRALAAEYDGV